MLESAQTGQPIGTALQAPQRGSVVETTQRRQLVVATHQALQNRAVLHGASVLEIADQCRYSLISAIHTFHFHRRADAVATDEIAIAYRAARLKMEPKYETHAEPNVMRASRAL